LVISTFSSYLDNFYTAVRKCPETDEYPDEYFWFFDTCVDSCPLTTSLVDQRCNYICEDTVPDSCVNTDTNNPGGRYLIYPYEYDCLENIYSDCCNENPLDEC